MKESHIQKVLGAMIVVSGMTLVLSVVFEGEGGEVFEGDGRHYLEGRAAFAQFADGSGFANSWQS